MNRRDMKPEDVRSELEIDIDNLTGELRGDSSLIHDVGFAHAEAISRRDSQKDHVKRLESDVATEVREELRAELGKEPAAKLVDEAVAKNETVVDANEKLRVLEEECRKWDVSSESVKRRHYALHKIADLELAHARSTRGPSHHEALEADAKSQESLRARRERRERPQDAEPVKEEPKRRERKPRS